MPEALLTATQVSRVLGHRSPTWFPRHRTRLEAEGFPLPVKGVGPRWDPLAIEAWLAQQRPAAHSTAPATGDWEARLMARLQVANAA